MGMRVPASVLGAALVLAMAIPARQSAFPWTEPATGMTFVHIAPGAFAMGSPLDEVGREPQEALHEVRVSRGFWLGAYEVTQAEWRAVMHGNPSHFRGDGRLPVEEITWFDAQEFLRRLERQDGGSRFRLPTEAEWEYACRAGAATPYQTGASLDPAHANVARSIEDSIAGRGRTLPVGSFAANAWGLHDMHGNVWEWTADDHCPYGTAPAHDAASCGSGLKVIRGGSWYFEADSARCALRYTHRPQDRGFSLGFRVLREE